MLHDEPLLFRRLLSGEAGAWATPLLAGLRVASGVYGWGVRLRNARYDRRGPTRVLPVPVISVGNITAGGTGKTPLVIDIVHRLEGLGMSPAVVSRGYGSIAGEPNDEERLIRRHCPTVACVSDPDRARGGETACRRFGADVIVLDDGFQHRQLARCLDIVVIDATCPFGYGRLLPRGLLREPPEALSRAHVIVLSRCDQISGHDLTRLEQRLRTLAGGAVHIKCHHAVIGCECLDGTPLSEPIAGKRAVLFAGIGQPRAFRNTVRGMGIEVVGERWFPDHHRYRARDIRSLTHQGRFPPHDLLLTTEKDAVKLAELPEHKATNIVVVRTAIDFLADGNTMLQSAVEHAIGAK